MESIAKVWARSAWEMLFPKLCLSCQADSVVPQHEFCVSCLKEYYETDFDAVEDNPVARHFYGRIPFKKAASLLNFQKGGVSQSLLHALKYESRKEVGIWMGRRMGQLWNRSGFFDGIEAILPIPLHPKKLRVRGYNQSAVIAEGLQEMTGIPVWEDLVVRKRKTESQTRKTRTERLRNMASAFTFSDRYTKLPNHVLILDDVITTGATIEACANSLLKGHPNCKLSIAALALG